MVLPLTLNESADDLADLVKAEVLSLSLSLSRARARHTHIHTHTHTHTAVERSCQSGLVKAEVPRQSVGGGKLIQQRTRVRYPLFKTTVLRGNGHLATRS